MKKESVVGAVVGKVLSSKPVRAASFVNKSRGQIQAGKAKGAETAATLQEAQKTPPPPQGVRSVTASLMEKDAWNVGKRLLESAEEKPVRSLLTLGLGIGAMHAGTAAMKPVIQGVATGIGGMFERSHRKKLYEELVRRNPSLSRDPRAREYFDLAMTYAPSLGRHPLAIGDFLKKQLQYPVSSHEFLKALADFESTVSRTDEGRTPHRMGLAFEEGSREPFSAYLGSYASERGKDKA
jgi:hypothetical protein